MSFQPGQSGNPGGGVREKRFYSTLNRAIAQEDGRRLRNAVEKLLDLASEGVPWAVQMLADRMDGKPTQQLDHGNADGKAFVVQFDSPDGDA